MPVVLLADVVVVAAIVVVLGVVVARDVVVNIDNISAHTTAIFSTLVYIGDGRQECAA